jgi:hypothetical protein
MEASAEKELGWEFAGGHNFHDLHPEADGDKIHDPPRESNKTLRGARNPESGSGYLDLLSVFPEPVDVAKP